MESDKGGPSRAVADIGSHWCDLSQHISGHKIVEVYAQLETIIEKRKKPKESTQTFSNGDRANLYEDVTVDTEDYATVLIK